MIALTGGRTLTNGLRRHQRGGIVVSYTGGAPSTAGDRRTALGLLLSAERHFRAQMRLCIKADSREACLQDRCSRGKTLGVTWWARSARRWRATDRRWACGLAWSQNMTEEKAAAAGANLVDKRRSVRVGVISLHLVLSDRTRGVVGAQDLACHEAGAILVNTSRGPLVDEAALVEDSGPGKLIAALDVYAQEPLPADHPLRSSLTPC